MCMGNGTSTNSLASIPKQFSIASTMALFAFRLDLIVW